MTLASATLFACGTTATNPDADTVRDSGGDGSTADAGPPDSGIDCTGRPVDGPSPRGEATGVVDVAHDRLVVIGGNTGAPVMCMPMTTLTDQTWAFHFDCATWEPLASTGGPGARSRQAAALDAAGHRMLVFGGRSSMGFGAYVNYADVYAFDLDANTWSPLATTGSGPSPRSSATAVVDAAKNRLLVFGGNTSTSGLTLTGVGDLYALDLATGAWTAIAATGAPSPRLYHAAGIVGHEMVVYGGTPNFSGPFLDDALAFDLVTDTWRTVSASGGPEARFGASLVPDDIHGRALVFGGHDGTAAGNRNDAWALTLATGVWSTVRPGDTLTGVATGMCNFPPDFTSPEPGSPERRYAMVAGARPDAAIFFAGKTDCGNVNDVWSLAFADGAWTKLRTTNGGEACNRSGSTTCSTLCF